MSFSRAPELVMVNPPETKIRFRYLSEGGSHGGLTGKHKSNGKKSYPTVKLINYRGKKRVFVRVSLFTEDEKEHVLEFKEKKAEEAVPHMTEPIKDDGTAVFSDLKILCKKKHEIEELLMDRKIKNLKDGITSVVRAQFEKKYSKEVKERAKAILNSVRLKFVAFEEDKPNVPLCSLFSEIICNQKAASKGDLKIYRLSRIAGSWKGGDEVILLCDKVQKENIKVRFFEMDSTTKEVTWEGYGSFSQADVHFQVAITFKTPPYKKNAEKTVHVCLERNLKDSIERSETREFTYFPEDSHIPKKRKFDHSSNAPPKEDVIMNHQEIAESSPMDVNSSDSSSNDSQSRRGYFRTDLNMNLYSPNGVESFENAFCSEVSNNATNASEISLYENTLWEFGIGLQDLGVGPQDLGLESLELDSLYDTLLPQPEGEVVDNYPEERIYNQCLQPVEIDCPVGQMGVDRFVGEMGVDRYVGQMGADCPIGQMGNIFSNLSICTVDGVKSKACVQTLKEEKYKIFEPSPKKQYNVEKIRKVLSKRDDLGNTLLHVAVRLNQKFPNIIAMVRIANCDIINEQNHQKQTALHIATEKNNEEAVKILLKNGANPNMKDIDGNNCYHIAASHHSYEALMCTFYIQNIPPAINAFNYEGLTPLHIAVMKNSVNCFHLLRTHMADTGLVEKKCDKSLLHIAVEFQPSFVPILLEMEEIDVNVQDLEGNTALHMACAVENANVVKLLLEAGADPSIRNCKRNYYNLTQSREDISDGQVQAEKASNNIENDEDTSDGEAPEEMTSNSRENDEDTSDGETPADMTSNTLIQEMLKIAAEPKVVNSSESLPSLKELSGDETLKELCAYLDGEGRWKRIAVFLIDEILISSLECSESPTKALLTYIKKEHQNSYIEHLKEVLKIAGLTEAIKIIDGEHL